MFETIVLQLLNGLIVGSIYALIALGYTMVYGILRLINFAHGEIFVVGAFAGLLATMIFGDSFIIAIIFASITSVLLGLFVERVAYRPLRDSKTSTIVFSAVGLFAIVFVAFLSQNTIFDLLTSILFWLGVLFLIAIIVWLVRSKSYLKSRTSTSRINALISAIAMGIVISNMIALIKGPDREVYPKLIPDVMFDVFGINVSLLQLFIISFSFVLMVILYIVVNKTKVGLAMRAVSYNLVAAKLMGINPDKIISFTFAIGSLLAAIAGVLVGTYYNIVDINVGMMYGLKAFIAAVLGGIGSIPGAVLGGIILGVVEVMGVAFISPSYRDAIAFGILIFILIVKPTGLFGSNTKEKI